MFTLQVLPIAYDYNYEQNGIVRCFSMLFFTQIVFTASAQLSDQMSIHDYHGRALAILLKRLGPDNVDVASSYNSLSIVHKKLVDLSQAKDYHDRALAIRLKKLGPDHVHVAGSYNSL